MALIEKGTFFLDHQATRDFHSKGKFLLCFTSGEEEFDDLVCFVMNTEHRMGKYRVLCNKPSAKFVLSPTVHKFSFLTDFSSLMLSEPLFYTVAELYTDKFKMFEKDIASEELLRQIHNCIDKNYLLPKHIALIKTSYK